MNQIRIMPWIIGTIGLIFAIVLGRMAGQSDTRNLGIIFGSFAILGVCLYLRTLIWMIIPLGWSLTGKISALPLPFNVRDLSVLLVTVMFGIFFALKMVRFKSSSGWIEILVFLNIGYIVTMFLRHPVGTEAFGSDMVGGRPYFNIAIALLAFFILRLVIISPSQAKMFPFLLLGGSLIVSALGVLTRLVPALVPVIAPLYSGLDAGNYLASQGYQEEAGAGQRFTEFVGPGQTICQILCSYFRPISLLLPAHPLRMFLLFSGIAGILFSGFRGAVVSVVLFFICASYFRGGGKDVVRSAFLGVVALLAAILIQLTIGLPLQAQRALSFIPIVHWNEQEMESAEGSTQWRIDMWKMVLSDSKYLKDRIFGDGFGFTANELRIMQAEAFGGTGFEGGAAQEGFMINGTFHSGPLSTIRYAGVVGLILFLAWLTHLGFQAPKLIRETRGTPYFSTALFVCVPLVYAPLYFIFIFGSYDGGVPDTLFTAGLVRLIQNSVEEYKRVEAAGKIEQPKENVGKPVISGNKRGEQVALS